MTDEATPETDEVGDQHSNEGKRTWRGGSGESFDESTRFDNRPEVPQTEGAKQSAGRSGHKVPLDPHADSNE